MDRKHELLVVRSRRHLSRLGAPLDVRHVGAHLLLEQRGEAVARLTPLGHDAFGLSFRGSLGAWEPMALVDALEEILADVVIALDLVAKPTSLSA